MTVQKSCHWEPIKKNILQNCFSKKAIYIFAAPIFSGAAKLVSARQSQTFCFTLWNRYAAIPQACSRQIIDWNLLTIIFIVRIALTIYLRSLINFSHSSTSLFDLYKSNRQTYKRQKNPTRTRTCYTPFWESNTTSRFVLCSAYDLHRSSWLKSVSHWVWGTRNSNIGL